jgi:pyruvate-formate lyase-activating enzyme
MFYEHVPPASKRIEGRLVRQSKLYIVKFGRDRLEGRPRRAQPMWKDLGDCFLVPVRRLDRVPYRGDVYNLEVANADHSYVAPYVAVANCQNWEISNEGAGQEVSARELAEMMLDLQRQGCHNINFVTPEHVVPQVLEALPYALEGGLRLPIVYNTSAYDSLHSLGLLDGVVDIYMPDFKYWDEGAAARILKAKDYPEVARRVVREMHRQVGDLVMDGDGLARRGLLVRHLVMPDGLADSARIFEWLAGAIGRETYVNVMDQYHPDGMVARRPERYPQLARPLSAGEHERALELARAAGLCRIDERAPHPRLRRRLRVF